MTAAEFTEPPARPCTAETCAAPIWPVTVASSRRRMWCDAGTLGAPGGTVAVWADPGRGLLARVVSAARPLAAGERLAVAHWATCTSAAEFRAAPPGPVHPCPGPGCTIVNVPVHQLACAGHWGQVDRPHQRAVYRAWDHGAGAGTAAHDAACAAAVARMRPLGGAR
jgi:hypothetical protein